MIRIVNARGGWATDFLMERDRIFPALAPWALSVRHMGSTSVPGLAAKPVIDILLGVRTLKEADSHIVPLLQQLGYVYVAEYEARLPDRRFFTRDTSGERSHQIHLVEQGSKFWRDHVLFPEYLRAHPEATAAYAALKHDLAPRFSDTNSYADAKGEFIGAMMQDARAWLAATAPQLACARLRLRAWGDEDVESLYQMNADPAVMEFMYSPEPWSRQAATRQLESLRQHFKTHGFGLWAVCTPDEREALGWVGLNIPSYPLPFMPAVELSWRLHKRAWRQGYATEAARAALKFAFDRLGLQQVVAFTTPQNLRSIRVMEKLGLRSNPSENFEHPVLPLGHPLRMHVLYRLGAP